MRSANSSTARATNAGVERGGGAEDRRARRRPRAPRSIASSVRSPPPTCTGITTACADVARSTSRLSPVARGRRRGRRRAAAARPPPGSARRPPRGRRRTTVSSSGSPRSRRTARPPRRSIAGITITLGHLLHEVARTAASPASPDFSGWNCVANTFSCATAGGERAAVLASRPRCRRPDVGGERVDEVEAGAVGHAVGVRVAARPRSTVFQPMCGTFTVVGQPSHAARRACRDPPRGPRRSPRTGPASRRRPRTRGVPRRRRNASGASQPAARRAPARTRRSARRPGSRARRRRPTVGRVAGRPRTRRPTRSRARETECRFPMP